MRAALARAVVRFAARVRDRAPARADRWLRLAAALAPAYGEPHAALVELRHAQSDRPGALTAARAAVARFPENPDAWMRLGAAARFAYRVDEALSAYERVIAIEERADALLAAGELYERAERYADAAARFARAYAAAGDAALLRRNAMALFRAGDERAADEALALWATLVPGGLERLPEERVLLRGGS